MSVFKKIPAILTAISLVAVCTSCGSNTTTAMTIDDYVVPAGVYLYYLNSSYSNALSQLQQEDETLDTEDTKTIKTLSLEDKDIRTWIEDKATELCIDFVATEKKFDELGLELDEEVKENLPDMQEYYWSYYSDAFLELGISQESFNKVMTSSYKSQAIFDYYYAVDGQEGVTEEELQDYYAENNMRVQYIQFDLHDNEGNLLDSDGKAKILELAKEYQTRAEDAYQNGGAEAVMTEMDYIQEDYNYYMTSVSEQEAGIDEEELTTTTPRTSTTETTTTTTQETTTIAENEESQETTTILDENGEESETVTSIPENPEETLETTTTIPNDENNEETDLTDLLSDYNDTETVAVPYLNESVISIINKEDYDNEEDIYYTPSEAVYHKLLEISDSDYGKVYLVEEDEAYYLVTRYDIRERMTEDDLWTESTIDSVDLSKYSDAFEDKMEEWSAILNVEKNLASFKRYDPFAYHVS
ncbi:MAG: hypothetical protein K2J25_04125 [Oscillospiraceae bacterium]|nr:hypothetical protein [Oscillospiraceae bacterium]